MNHHHTPPLINRPTFAQILEKTTAVIFTRHHLFQFLFLSFILLCVRSNMDYTTHQVLTSFIDNDPSIKPLFIGDQFFDSFNTQLGFSNASLSVNDRNTEIEHQASTALYALGSFCVSYGYMLLVYVLSQSIIHGIIFVFVVNDPILDNRNSFMNTCRKGVILGLNRMPGLILFKWGLMQLIVQILSLWFVGIDDKYLDFKILVRLKFLPFSVGLKWVMEGYQKEIYGFLLTYFPLELLILYLYAICVWVVMADSRKTYREVIREGRYMLSLSIGPAIYLKLLESKVYMVFAIISKVSGEFLASFFLSFMVIYLMVAWMMYYFSLKSMDANSRGVPFGEVEFNDMLNDDR